MKIKKLKKKYGITEEEFSVLPSSLRNVIINSDELDSRISKNQSEANKSRIKASKTIQKYLDKNKAENPTPGKKRVISFDLGLSPDRLDAVEMMYRFYGRHIHRWKPDTPTPEKKAEPQVEPKAVQLMRKHFEECLELCAKKNHDYANPEDPWANFRDSDDTGIPTWQATFIRLLDKVSRIKGFIKRGVLEVKDESIEDTMKDLINYSVIMFILYRETKTPISKNSLSSCDTPLTLTNENIGQAIEDARECLNNDF